MMNRKLFLMCLWLSASASLTHAENVQSKSTAMPSGAAVQKEMQRIESERKAMFDSTNPATQPGGSNFPVIATPPVSEIDIQKVAQRYEQRAQARRTDALMIFVSFTMPAESLKRIVFQAHKVGASVIVNGFKNNSLRATTEAIQQLGEASGNVLINPNAFARYEIKSIPVVVLTKPESTEQLDDNGCALPDTYVAIAGDVSLDYALDEIMKRDSSFADLASSYYRQLKASL